MSLRAILDRREYLEIIDQDSRSSILRIALLEAGALEITA
jgi:hypothetical protein